MGDIPPPEFSDRAELDAEYKLLSNRLSHLGIKIELEDEYRVYDASFLEAASEFLDSLPELLPEVLRLALRDNHPTAVDWCLQGGEPAISEEEFLSRIRLKRLHLMSSGHYTFWFDDGDVFLGHSIYVEGGPKGLKCSGF